MAKCIELTREQVAIVDDEDFDRLNQWSWYCTNSGYAYRRLPASDGKHMQGMHREIMKPPVGWTVDHINKNKLDNRRANLRLATISQQNQNRGKVCPTAHSSFTGVRRSHSNRWSATIGHNYRAHHLGSFDSEVQAALAYDEAARKIYGYFAHVNFPLPW